MAYPAIVLTLDRDWHKDKRIDLEDGAILKFLGQDYYYDHKLIRCVFSIIGNPVPQLTSFNVPEVEFK